MRTFPRMSWAVDIRDSDIGVRVVPRGDVPLAMRRFCESIDRKCMSVDVAYSFVKNFAKERDL